MRTYDGTLSYGPALLAAIPDKKFIRFETGDVIFQAGDPNDYIYYVETGRIKVSIISQNGKEAVIGLLDAGQFLGESALMDFPTRLAGAVCLSVCKLWRMEKEQVLQLLERDKQFAESLLRYLIDRNRRYEEDLADRTFHCSEKRLARALLLITHFGRKDRCKSVPTISHQVLAELVGTTRARITHFMKSFRSQGLIEYDRHTLTVRHDLINVLLRE